MRLSAPWRGNFYGCSHGGCILLIKLSTYLNLLYNDMDTSHNRFDHGLFPLSHGIADWRCDKSQFQLAGSCRKRLRVVAHVVENLETYYDEQTCLSAEAIMHKDNKGARTTEIGSKCYPTKISTRLTLQVPTTVKEHMKTFKQPHQHVIWALQGMYADAMSQLEQLLPVVGSVMHVQLQGTSGNGPVLFITKVYSE